MSKKEEKKGSKLRVFIISIILIISLIILYGRFVEPSIILVNEYNIEDSNLDKSFNTLKIVHFSDILYGSTTDIELRLREHQAGLGGYFTRTHLPVKLVYVEEYASIELAFERERQLHGWSRAKKEALINGKFEDLSDLSRK